MIPMSNLGFNHSTARVPRLYKEAGKIVQQVKEEGGSFKGLIYKSKHRSLKSLYALVAETLRHGTELDLLLRRTQLLLKEPRLDPWLARVLITELLWRQRTLSGPAIPLKIILGYKDELTAQLAAHPPQNFTTENNDVRPRFVRVNILKTTVEKIIDTFILQGWQEVKIPLHQYSDDKKAYIHFCDKVARLSEGEFMRDIHIPDLLIFPRSMEFYHLDEYRDGLLLLQDKASCMSAFLLDAPCGSTVLDMCAAPGMKTTHLAATLGNKGIVYAIEKHQDRYQSLCEIVSNAGATCVKPILGDARKFAESDLPGVEYIIVDPTCSGSGMKYRKEIFGESEEISKNRLEKLSHFQCVLLKHAMTSFPQAKRIVYSTCSVHREENEAVVESVLKNCPPNFQPVLPSNGTSWMKPGSSDFEHGTFGLYTQPDVDLTNGFFVTVFERTENEYSISETLRQNFSPSEQQIKINTPKNKKKEKKEKKEKLASCERKAVPDPAIERMRKAMLNIKEVQNEEKSAGGKQVPSSPSKNEEDGIKVVLNKTQSLNPGSSPKPKKPKKRKRDKVEGTNLRSKQSKM